MTFEEKDRLVELLGKFCQANAPMVKELEKVAKKVPPMAVRVAEEKRRLAAAQLLISYLTSGERVTISSRDEKEGGP